MSESTGGQMMLLLGTDPAYLLNTPSAAPPGNVQAVFKVRLRADDAAQVEALGPEDSRDPMTVVPHALDLVALSPFVDPQLPTDLDVAIGHHGGLIAEDTVLEVEKVVSWTELSTDEVERPPGELEYVIFGDADTGLYLAHQMLGISDFQQLLSATVTGQHLTEAELQRQGRPTLKIPDHTDDRESMLKPGERVAGRTSAGQHFVNKVEVEVLRQLG